MAFNVAGDSSWFGHRASWLSLLGLISLSWLYMLYGMSMVMTPHWEAYELLMVFLMWAIMMTGMMLPSAAPMILLFAKINRERRARGSEFVSSSLFIFGYLLCWIFYSLIITLVQWQLHENALMSPMMHMENRWLAAALLLSIAAYQLSPLKRQCLRYCRSPLNFLMNQWREGRRGALKMGLKHGQYCLGCCWLLMALLLVVGVMDLVWILGLSILVLVEKLLPLPRVTDVIIAGGCFIGALALLLH